MLFAGTFVALLGGRLYIGRRSFEARKLEEVERCKIYRDIYGRRVYAFSERYPIFDSYDALYDERRFHWYYVDCGGHVAALYWDDDHQMKVFRRLKRESFRDSVHLHRDHLEFLEKRGLLMPKPEG